MCRKFEKNVAPKLFPTIVATIVISRPSLPFGNLGGVCLTRECPGSEHIRSLCPSPRCRSPLADARDGNAAGTQQATSPYFSVSASRKYHILSACLTAIHLLLNAMKTVVS